MDKASKNMKQSGEISISSNVEASKVGRQCAFCLKPGATKRCLGCRRRPYCSSDCQTRDWEPNGHGQGHKMWCKKKCGEEDFDWFATPDKGKGVFAKRKLPPKYLVIVEPVFTDPEGHAAIKDLMPLEGTLEDKFYINAFHDDGSSGPSSDWVALRMSRVNHSCNPNAGHFYCKDSRVEILYTINEIQAGEEITINYLTFKKIDPDKANSPAKVNAEFMSSKETLHEVWGIVCPPDCVCNDPNVRHIIFEGRALATDIERLGNEGTPQAALKLVTDLKKIHEKIKSPWMERVNTLVMAATVAAKHRETRNIAKEYATEAEEICSEVCPFSTAIKQLEERLCL